MRLKAQVTASTLCADGSVSAKRHAMRHAIILMFLIVLIFLSLHQLVMLKTQVPYASA